MKKHIIKTLIPLVWVITFFMASACTHADKKAASTASSTETSGYDSVLAARYGADDYGMKSYIMAFLKRGPNRDRSPEEAAALQKAHLKNIIRLAEEGKLVLAGPFADTGEVRGIYVFNVSSIEEARTLTSTDPAIQAGSLAMELRPWYGTAALMGINDLSKRLAKTSIVQD
ncbi:MAG: YciI family protein [Bacteroidia bacterium]